MRIVGHGLGIMLLVAGCASQEGASSAPAPTRATPASTAAAPSGQHWLVGRWRGEVAGTTDGGRRSLTVTAVAPDGAVTGRWGGQSVPMTLSGDTLRLVSAGSSTYELRRNGPNALQGTQQSGRNVRPFTMTRE